MQAEQNKQLMRRFVEEVFEKRDFDAIDTYIAPNFVDHNAFPGQSPGVQGVREFFELMARAFPDSTYTVEEYIAEGDKVVVIGSLRGTHRGEFLGLSATGKRIDVPSIDVLRFEDGKQVEHWGLLDQQAMLEQLGVTAQQVRAGTGDTSGAGLYARLTSLQGKPEKVADGIRYMQETVVPAAQQLSGFRGLISLADRKSGKGVSLTLWESEDALRRSEEAGKRLRSDAATRFGATAEPSVERYEVVAQVIVGTPEPLATTGRRQ
jgi:steroid delta-isomerase-like uncharacterized protein